MFGKLVKHEFRATARIIPFVFLVTIFLGLVHIITTRFNLGAISKISLVLMIVMCFAQVAVAFVLLIWRYYKNMYSSEAYLTHTLPVPPSMLLWSKLLVAFVWSVLSYLIGAAVFAGVMIADFVKSVQELKAISTVYQGFLVQTGLVNDQVGLWIVVACILTLSICMFFAEAYFAITAGSLSKLHSLGIGGPVLVYFAEYIVLQIVNMVVVLFVPLGVKINTDANGVLTGFKIVTQNMFSQIRGIMGSGNTPGNGPEIVGIAQYILLPLLAIGLFCLTARIISRHTSVK